VQTPAWSVVIPVKPLTIAKTRLRGALPAAEHEGLVLALALDTLTAARASAGVAAVYVISDDPTIGREARTLGAAVLPDRPRAGLNAALTYGAASASAEGRPDRWVAALAADLPALRAQELSAALRAAAGQPRRAYVADAPGTGTTLLAAPPGAALDPRFGPDSAAAHAASGARPLPGDWPSLRRDVDTAADLVEAAALGLGARTATVYRQRMQGTVASYDPETRSGTLLLDDGTELEFPAPAFDASGLRLLRLGQRVRIESDEFGQVTRITLPTFR
jgi:2-phospho-L-lactate guanylyltransferase